MNGNRSLRASGTDGSDHQFRQVLDARYSIMAASKARLQYVSYAHFIAAALLLLLCFTQPLALGFDSGLALRLLWAGLVCATAPLGTLYTARGVTDAIGGYIIAMAVTAALATVLALTALAHSEQAGIAPLGVHALTAAVAAAGAITAKTLQAAAAKKPTGGVRQRVA